jgi:1-acyl-sn-glycerol-3-phosphate acyltransferase
LRLVSLWLSQVARILADNCLRAFVVLMAAEAGAGAREASWHLVAGLFVLPAVFLAPFNGATANSLPKQRVLVGAAGFCLIAVLAFATLDSGWLACVALVATGQALYSPARYALLPAAARDSGIPLSRVNGWIEMGAVGAIVLGLMLGGALYDLPPSGVMQRPPVVLAVAALNVLALVTAMPVRFRSDLWRPDLMWPALVGFFHDGRRVLERRAARWPLLGLAGLRALVAGLVGAIVAGSLSRPGLAGQPMPIWELVGNGFWVMAGVAAGSLAAGIQRHPRRVLGLVPVSVTVLAFAVVWAAAGGPPGWGSCLVAGAMGGVVNVALLTTYQEAVPADARGNGMAVLNAAGYIGMAAMAVLLAGLAYYGVLTPAGQVWLLAVLTSIGAVAAWRVLFRETLEQALEIVLWPVYRIRGRGPGIEACPRSGPLIVVANHSSYFDPLWLAKVLPRRLIAMMTSEFYDRPFLHFLVARVAHAIRVQSSGFRREAPELKEAVAALDRGECLVIFPEGRLRRRADLPLRPFGQGVWHILRERPATPVLVCWIEGGWGSYMSYAGGPPLANKRPDWWRRIDIAATEPRMIEPSVLADQRRTRSYLWKACREARTCLGLEPAGPAQSATEEPALAGEDVESS